MVEALQEICRYFAVFMFGWLACLVVSWYCYGRKKGGATVKNPPRRLIYVSYEDFPDGTEQHIFGLCSDFFIVRLRSSGPLAEYLEAEQRALQSAARALPQTALSIGLSLDQTRCNPHGCESPHD